MDSNSHGSTSYLTIRPVDPEVPLVLDSYNGLGHDGDVVGTDTAEFDKDNLRIDAKGGAFGYSWDEVAGLTGGAYSSEHTLTITE